MICPQGKVGPAMGHLGCRRDPAELRGERFGLLHVVLAGRHPIGDWEKSIFMVWLVDCVHGVTRRSSSDKTVTQLGLQAEI